MIVSDVQIFRFNAPLSYNDLREQVFPRTISSQFGTTTWTQDDRVTALTISGI
jgi:hypothetical protein